MDNAKLAIDNATTSWLTVGLQAVAVAIAIWQLTRARFQSPSEAATTNTTASAKLLSALILGTAIILFFISMATWQKDIYVSLGMDAAATLLVTFDYIVVPLPFSRWRTAYLVYCWASFVYLSAVVSSWLLSLAAIKYVSDGVFEELSKHK
jgi:hypothetical protein